MAHGCKQVDDFDGVGNDDDDDDDSDDDGDDDDDDDDDDNLLPVKMGPWVRTSGGGFDLWGRPWIELCSMSWEMF